MSHSITKIHLKVRKAFTLPEGSRKIGASGRLWIIYSIPDNACCIGSFWVTSITNGDGRTFKLCDFFILVTKSEIKVPWMAYYTKTYQSVVLICWYQWIFTKCQGNAKARRPLTGWERISSSIYLRYPYMQAQTNGNYKAASLNILRYL